MPRKVGSGSGRRNGIWAANHQMVAITIEVQATENCGPTSSKIVAVTSNEPIGSLREGSDWLITGDLRADLRAERLGRGQGRIYSILGKCDDVAGNSSLRAATRAVPHD